MCALFGVSKQAYYKFDDSKVARKIAREAFALEFVHRIRKQNARIGGKKLWLMYCKEIKGSDRMGRDGFEDMIDRYGSRYVSPGRQIQPMDCQYSRIWSTPSYRRASTSFG